MRTLPHFPPPCVYLDVPYPTVTKAPGQAPSVAAFSAFTAALTFLPEALDAFERRGRARSLERIKRGGKSSRVVELAIALSNVGCAACAVSVRKALEKSPLVASVVSVDVDTAMAVVELTTNVDCGGEGGDSQDAQLSLRSATEQLTAVLRAAGYAPADAAVPNGTDTDADTDAGTRDSKKTVTTSAQPSSSSGAVLGAVLGGLACSSCCAIQLGLNAAASAGLGLSVGCAGFNKTLGPLRSVMRGLTALYYAYMWVRALFFAKVNGGGGGSCGDTVMKSGDGDGRCPPSQTAKAKSATLRSLALSTTMCVALTFLPELLLATGGPALAAPTTGAQRISLSISGMGCEACQVHVRETLLTASGAGVLDASADFTTGKAEVWVNPDWGGDGVGFDLDKVRANLAEMGYELEETQKGKAQGKTALTGAGAATVTVPNQTISKEDL